MRDFLLISDVSFSPSRSADEGLKGYLSFKLAGSILVDGVTLRRTREGRLVLTNPRKDLRQTCQASYSG